MSLAASNTIASKLKFEREAGGVGVEAKQYCSDNGIYTSAHFMSELASKDQTIQYSGVGAHH